MKNNREYSLQIDSVGDAHLKVNNVTIAYVLNSGIMVHSVVDNAEDRNELKKAGVRLDDYNQIVSL